MIEVGSTTPADALYMGISSVARMTPAKAGGIRGQQPRISLPPSRSALRRTHTRRSSRSERRRVAHAGYVSYTSTVAAETNEFDGPLPTRERTRRHNADYIFLR